MWALHCPFIVLSQLRIQSLKLLTLILKDNVSGFFEVIISFSLKSKVFFTFMTIVFYCSFDFSRWAFGCKLILSSKSQKAAKNWITKFLSRLWRNFVAESLFNFGKMQTLNLHKTQYGGIQRKCNMERFVWDTNDSDLCMSSSLN